MFLRVRDTHGRSIAKAISWRILGSLDTFLISLVITGNLTAASSIASVETLSKIVLYYLHERAWARIPLGRKVRGAPAPSIIPDHAIPDAICASCAADTARLSQDFPAALSQGAR
jgi:uncharacterized membrane protein